MGTSVSNHGDKPPVSTTCLLVPRYSHTTVFILFFSFQLTPSTLIFFLFFLLSPNQ